MSVSPSLYRLKLDDGGRNRSKRPLQRSDCCVRALAIATGRPYDLVYQVLAKAGRRCSDGFDLTTYLAHRRAFLGHSFKRITFRSQTTIDEVVQAYQWGRVIIDLDDHVMAVIDGTVHDLVRLRGNTRVLGIWRFA